MFIYKEVFVRIVLLTLSFIIVFLILFIGIFFIYKQYKSDKKDYDM